MPLFRYETVTIRTREGLIVTLELKIRHGDLKIVDVRVAAQKLTTSAAMPQPHPSAS